MSQSSSDSYKQHPSYKKEILKRKQQQYFQCYTELAIHETMLKDKPRTLAYKKAIQTNKELFQDKIVLDIGSGTLILSLFASEYAKTVYAVQNSKINRFADNIKQLNQKNNIVVIDGKIQNVDIPQKVDIIISQWMGYGLFFEDMQNSVIGAIKKYLKPDGHVFPSKAKIYLAPGTNQKLKNQKINFWDNVYGYNMSVCKDQLLTQIHVQNCSQSIISKSQLVYEMDMKQIAQFHQDQYFRCSFEFQGSQRIVDHFVFWFDIQFPGGQVLSTGPKCQLTHWKQCVIFLKNPTIFKNKIQGQFMMMRHPKAFRKMAVDLIYKIDNEIEERQTYFMI